MRHVRRIEHVQLAMPPGKEAEARAFYGGVMGMTEVPKPFNLASRGGCWFEDLSEDGAMKLHLGVEDDFRPARKAHTALVVEGLDGLLAAARALGCDVRDPEPAGDFVQAYVYDPFGNRLELLERRDGGGQ